MEPTILLIDDEEEILALLSQALQSEGYNVLTASDGEKGVIEFKNSTPDLVITDVKNYQWRKVEW